MTTRKLAALVAAVLVGTSAPSAAVAVDTSEREAATLQRDVNALRATGATGVLAEVSGSRRPLAARAGVADPATGEPVPWKAKHRIASTTKTFVATVVLQLVAEGRIGMDDPVQRWLPGLVGENGNDGTKITVRHLLWQKSGLPDYLDDLPLERATSPEDFRRERFRAYSPEQLVAMAVRKQREFEPGTKWGYSNTNYVLAEMIIEKVISTTSDVNRFFSALLGGRLLKPAQLAEMRKTERAEQYEIVWDEPGYGLDLMKRRTSCGEEVWLHAGGYLNAITDNAVTSDGRRAVTVVIASAVEPDQSPIAQYKASAALIDHALCGAKVG